MVQKIPLVVLALRQEVVPVLSLSHNLTVVSDGVCSPLFDGPEEKDQGQSRM